MMGRHFTVSRRDLLPDDNAWYGCEATQRYCQALGTDDFMTSQFMISTNFINQSFNLHRDRNDPPFALHDTRLIHLFHTELGRLWDKKELPKPDPCEGISPRMRQIVAFLREGFSEKEIAAKTKLSVHTVHDYVKRLHTHFGVSNRAGLLVATNPPPVPYRPALSP